VVVYTQLPTYAIAVALVAVIIQVDYSSLWFSPSNLDSSLRYQ